MSEPFIISKVIESNYCPGGIFTFAYNEYTVVTHPFGWVSKRREGDFQKLRDYLSKAYPQYCIPPLVFPKAVYDNYSLKEKEIYFTKFLNDILSNEELRACTYLELFLTIENEDKFKSIRKKYEKLSVKPTDLSDFCTIDGKVSINYFRIEPIWVLGFKLRMKMGFAKRQLQIRLCMRIQLGSEQGVLRKGYYAN